MNIQLIALMLGMFVVPAILLTAGHKLRKRSPRVQSAFWGAIVGHVIAMLLASYFGMMPAELWQSSDTVRGFFGFWFMLIGPVIGGAIGSLRAGTTPKRS
jgi:putative Ca2+/H+ antiporter (TMEM165/GDT1 family)